jgi:(R,R)-butanediol dehydrogenase/meso-butanediol dehydrogenase/diacetyl reductase
VRGFPERCTDLHLSVSFEVDGKKVTRFPSGFGEYTMGHEGKAFKLPDGVTHLEAAVTTDMGYVLGVIKRSQAKVGDSAVVLGAGPIGLRTVEAARLAGIIPIIVSEPVDYRLDCAKELGAHELVNPNEEDAVAKVMELTDGEGVDYVFDTTGSAGATSQGVEMLNTRFGGMGTLVLMGLYENPELKIDASKLMKKAGRIVAEWGVRSTRRKNIEDALRLMGEGKLNISKWITHQLPESQAEEGMMMLIEKREGAIGIEIVH